MVGEYEYFWYIPPLRLHIFRSGQKQSFWDNLFYLLPIFIPDTYLETIVALLKHRVKIKKTKEKVVSYGFGPKPF